MLEPMGFFGKADEVHPDNEFNFKESVLKPFTSDDIDALNTIEKRCYEIFVMNRMPMLISMFCKDNGLPKTFDSGCMCFCLFIQLKNIRNAKYQECVNGTFE